VSFFKIKFIAVLQQINFIIAFIKKKSDAKNAQKLGGIWVEYSYI
jgi:hypothetical protein